MAGRARDWRSGGIRLVPRTGEAVKEHESRYVVCAWVSEGGGSMRGDWVCLGAESAGYAALRVGCVIGQHHPYMPTIVGVLRLTVGEYQEAGPDEVGYGWSPLTDPTHFTPAVELLTERLNALGREYFAEVESVQWEPDAADALVKRIVGGGFIPEAGTTGEA